MPFKIIPGKPDHYLLIIAYNGKEYKYEARMYYFINSVESWYIKAKDNVILNFSYNVNTKELKQEFVYTAQPVPADFLKALEKEFQEK